MAGERVPVGGMPGRGKAERAWRLTIGATAVTMVVVLAWAYVVHPDTWGWGLAVNVMLALIWLGTWLDEIWLDTAGGRLCRRRAGVLPVAIPWTEVSVLRFRSTAGIVSLEVRSRFHWWSTYVPIVAADQRGLRGQPAALVRLLADEIRRWAPRGHHGVADQLDAQADHLEQTGRLLDSPLLWRCCGPVGGRPG